MSQSASAEDLAGAVFVLHLGIILAVPVSQLPALILSVILVGYSPGPCNVFALAMALRHGRKNALHVWFGMVAGYLLVGTLVLFAAHYADVACGALMRYLKYAGAGYVAYLAYRIYKTRGSDFGDGRGCTFASGFVMQLMNVKMIVYQLTAYSTFALPYSDGLVDLLPLFGILVLAGPGANLVWLLCGSRLHHLLTRHRVVTDTVMALALVACAALILAL